MTRIASPASPRWLRPLQLAVSLYLAALVTVCLVLSRNWPLVNDGALQHYISFLMDSGFAPYRQLLDMNLPGSLMIDWTVVHTLGSGPGAWRVFDALLMLAAGAAMLIIARPFGWFPGLVSAELFWLLHARDGIGQAGQRDLMEAALLLAMLAFAFISTRRGKLWAIAASGLCAGVALTIKPDSALLAAIVLALALRQQQPRSRQPSYAIVAASAFLLAPAATLAFLLHWHAVQAFWASLTEVIPFYARLGRLPLPELLRNCLSAAMRVLLALALVLSLRHRRRPWSFEQSLLALALLWGLASFLLQGKGYPYHRYPALGFLLLWVSIECSEALQSTSWRRIVGAVGLLYAALVIAPASLRHVQAAAWNQTLITALESDLTRLGGARLARDVQCIDSISGCNTALLRLQLPESTGMLSDFLLFGPPAEPAVRRTRAAFWSEINAHPPRVVVVTGWLHPSGTDHYAKLATWPDFARFLATRYTLSEERSFAPGQNGPLSYRIYLRRDALR